VAVGPSGDTYVTDAQNDVVNVYGPLGDLVRTIRVKYPLGVAVDGGGRVYIGSAVRDDNGLKKGVVTVYDSELNSLDTLGSGSGEFGKPLGIATDADRVYVADAQANKVKVYSIADGSYVSEFGGAGSAPGNLVNPDNVVVDPSTGNLIVTDRALVNDCTVTDPTDPNYQACQNQLMKGARVHEFTRDGVFVRSFGAYGFEDVAGTISLIGGLAVDNAGRIIVSDRTKNNLHVFDSSGNAVCAVGFEGSPGSQPQGLAATADGRLYIGASGRVVELGLDTYTKMVVSPEALAFTAHECGPQPAEGAVTVSNEGPGTLSFTITSDSAWLVTSTGADTVSGAGSVDVAVSVEQSGLGVGTHTGMLTVSSAGGDQTVAVTLEIEPGELSVSPSSLSFAIGETVKPLSINITGGDWEAVTDSTWLGISPAGGTTSMAALVSVDASGMTGGLHSGSITVGASCVSGEPITVPVTMEAIAGGTIEVTTNNEDASFSISGPESYSGTGTFFTVSGAPEGAYAVVFERVAGFKTPESCSLDVLNDETATCTGEYEDLREKLNILTTAGSTEGKATNELRILGLDDGGNPLELGTVVLKDESSKRYWDNAIAASGDVDGDGVEEIVVSHDVGVISALELDGTHVEGLNFMPFEGRTYVDLLEVADLDGDGVDEIIVSALNWSSNGATVRVFGYDALARSVVDTGVNFVAYTGEDWGVAQGSDRRGSRIAAGDVDGDGDAEILTVQGGGYSKHRISVRMFDVDGNWTVKSVGSIEVDDIISYYSDVTAGDLDADGVDEIIVSDAPEATEEAQDIRVLAFSAAGERLLDITANSIRGVEVAAGDLDFDGAAEIVVGEGAFKEGESSRVRVFNAQGELLSDFTAFDAKVYGVRVATGGLVSY
jgi:sugar lactone lactonase YvrE